MVNQQFSDSNHARLYSQYRRDPAPQVISRMIEYVKQSFPCGLTSAVDVGCGSGQSTAVLAPFFNHVTGLDASRAQVREARRTHAAHNVTYMVTEAELLPLGDCSVQLVSASSCLHWFDADLFFREADRVLQPGGVLATYAYSRLQPLVHDPEKSSMVQRLLDQTYQVLEPYFSSEVRLAFREYEDIDFPYKEVVRIRGIRQVFEGPLSEVSGLVSTLSAFQNMRNRDPDRAENFLVQFRASLCDILEVPEKTMVPLYRDFVLVLCRKDDPSAAQLKKTVNKLIHSNSFSHINVRPLRV